MHLRSSCVALVLPFTMALTPLVALAPVGVAHAQTTSHAAKKAEAAQVKAARAKFQEGVRAYDRKEYEKARTAFLEAYRLHAHPAIFLNIAQSALRTGRQLEAARYFRQFLREGNPAAAAASTAHDGLIEAEQSLGRLDIKGSPGLDAYVDGESVGTTPVAEAVDVAPGTHKVRIGTVEQQVTASAGQTVVVGDAAATASAPAKVAPAAAVTADSSGSKHSAFSPPAHMAPVYIAGGLVVAGVVTAVIASIERGKASDSATSATALINSHGGGSTTCASTDAATVAKFGQACSALTTDNNDVSKDGTVRDIGFIVGGVALVGGIIYYFAAPKADSAPATDAPGAASNGVHWDLTPILGRSTQGLSLTGSF